MRSTIISFITCLLMQSSCNSTSKNQYTLDSFNLSSDDSYILFSASNNAKSSIYKMDMNGKGLKIIVSSTNDSSFFNPKYSRDSKKILFIGNSLNGNRFSDIYIANNDGSARKRVTKESAMISEAFFFRVWGQNILCQIQ